MTDYPILTLNDERQIPQLGFGTYKIDEGDAPEIVKTALDVGYWLIDTAAIYENEKGVGKGIGDWSDIFLQTKIWNESQGYERTKKAAQKCLDRLGREHVDMLLIHWPCPDNGLFVETWKALIELRDEGKAKSIGRSARAKASTMTRSPRSPKRPAVRTARSSCAGISSTDWCRSPRHRAASISKPISKRSTSN